jgi:hypothetical protein
MEWFQAGGFGMFALLVIGAASIGYGVTAMRDPTAKRLAVLRALPGLLGTAALFTFGTDMWAVNRYLSRETATAASEALGHVGIVGITEAAQAFTLGGLLAFVVAMLRVVAESRLAARAER